MFQKLKEAEDKFNALDARMQHPDIFSNMELYYGSFKALKNINLKIKEKEITAFIGPSG